VGKLAEMLAGAGSDEPEGGMEEGGDDPKTLGVASVKAMFEAAKSGDYDMAFEHLCAACEHAESADMGDGMGEPDGDEGGSGHKGLAIMIGMPKGKR
jgi:hypothetical protein